MTREEILGKWLITPDVSSGNAILEDMSEFAQQEVAAALSTQSPKWVECKDGLPCKQGFYTIRGLNNQGNPVTHEGKDPIWFTGEPGNHWIVREGCKVTEWLDESLSSTHPLQEKITELLEANQGLREALAGVIKSWDSRSHEREEKKNTHGFDYWSPVASLVDSSAIAAAREALETYK